MKLFPIMRRISNGKLSATHLGNKSRPTVCLLFHNDKLCAAGLSSVIGEHEDMSKPVACKKCGAKIDLTMAERTGGLCVSCKDGQRQEVKLRMPPPPSTVLSMDMYLNLAQSVP